MEIDGGVVMVADEASARAAALACANEACRNMDGDLDLDAMTRHFLSFASSAAGQREGMPTWCEAITRELEKDDSISTETIIRLYRAFKTVAASPSAPEGRRDEVPWPPLTSPVRRILGTMCFEVGRYAHAYQAAGEFVGADGEPLKKCAEDEQAFILHRWLGYWFTHGESGWEAAAVADINRVGEIANERHAAEAGKR